MNRRDLFKFAGIGAAALLVPTTTYFLPPRFGWKPSQLGTGYMREVEQYIINTDSMLYRYDAIGRDIWGKEQQFHVVMDQASPEVAQQKIENRFHLDGLMAIPVGGSRQFNLALPGCAGRSRYL